MYQAVLMIGPVSLTEDVCIQLDLHKNYACFNTRRALMGIASFLRYGDPESDELINKILLYEQNTKKETRKRMASYKFLKGMMKNGYEYYEENPSEQIILNLFHNESIIHENVHSISYWILALLNSYSRSHHLEEILEFIVMCGFQKEDVLQSIDKLLKYKLVVSPESEKLTGTENLAISPSGEYYLNLLVSKQDYLYNVVFDTPLEHKEWKKVEKNSLSIALDSLQELIERVVREEKYCIEKISENEDAKSMLVAIHQSGLLCAQICNGTNKIIRSAERSEFDDISEIAKKGRKRLDKVRYEILMLSAMLDKSYENLYQKDIHYTREFPIKSFGDVNISLPICLNQTKILITTPNKYEEPMIIRSELINESGYKCFGIAKAIQKQEFNWQAKIDYYPPLKDFKNLKINIQIIVDDKSVGHIEKVGV